MTEKEPSVTSVAIKYGFIFALIGIVFSLILMVAGLSENRWLSSLSFLILIAGLVIAMKNYKELNHGFMSYGQGLGIGAIVSLIYGLLSGITTWIYTSFVDPDYMGRIMEKQREEWVRQGMSDEQIDAAVQMSQSFSGPVAMILGAAIGTLVIGFIISLIVSAIMKNKRPEFV